MKIILESELERYAWTETITALARWERHNGRTLRDYMEWWMEDLYEAPTEEAIRAEVERRLKEEFSDDLTVTEEEYVAAAMAGHGHHDCPEEDPAGQADLDAVIALVEPGQVLTEEEWDEQERQADKEWEQEYRQEYRDLQAEIAEEREELMDEVRDKLRRTYCMFFNDLDDLTVIFDGEVIQGK